MSTMRTNHTPLRWDVNPLGDLKLPGHAMATTKEETRVGTKEQINKKLTEARNVQDTDEHRGTLEREAAVNSVHEFVAGSGFDSL